MPSDMKLPPQDISLKNRKLLLDHYKSGKTYDSASMPNCKILILTDNRQADHKQLPY